MVKPGILVGLLLAAALALSGCALYDYRTGYQMPNSEKLGITDLTEGPGSQQVCKELPGSKPCYCMVCENTTSWHPLNLLTLKSWFDTTLEGGKCTIDSCNLSTAAKVIVDDNNRQLRTFMLGHGPTFTANDQSNLYCNYSNQLAVTWMKGANGVAPQVPKPKGASCWLERNILPLYIYYTGGSAIDPARTGAIATEMKDKGPVMITTELNLDSANAASVAAVKQQIYQIKRNCPNCLSVLSVKGGDVDAVRAVLDDTSTTYGGVNISSLTDMVGFGFRANDYPDCNVNRIIGYNLGFSRYLLKNYSKPTIWLYIGASEGNNIDGKCSFSPSAVREFYQSIFTGIQGFASSGVVGASFYEFSDRTGPLPCADGEGCDYGVIQQNGSQKHPEINTWSELCQYYTQAGYRSPLIFSRNAQGSVCDGLQNWKMYQIASEEVNTNLGLKYTPVAPLARQKKLNCGEICVSDIPLQKPEIYDSYSGPGSAFSSSHCSDFPQIDDIANDAEISAAYFRSVVQQESGFDPWVVSCNPTPCNYPSGTTMDQLCQAAGYPAGCQAHTLNQADNKKCPADAPYFCAMGLAQCIAKPGTLDMSKCGGGSYDPFNPSHSICCGVTELKTHLGTADAFLRANWAQLSACSDGMTQDEYDWAKYYLAANRYYGAPSTGNYKIGSTTKPLIDWFLEQRDLNGPCTGQQNYMVYLRTALTHESIHGFRDTDYGAKQLTIYLDAISKCQSDCPGSTPSSGLTPGETGDMRAFGHSLAVGTFKTNEAVISQQLSASGVSATLSPTVAREGATISETARNVRLAGPHKSIVLYTGANDLYRSEAEINAAFDSLFADAGAKANKVYVFNIIEFGATQPDWAKISHINSHIQDYISLRSPKFVLIDINQRMSQLGGACPYHSTDTHGCYQQTRSFFVSRVAASPPPA